MAGRSASLSAGRTVDSKDVVKVDPMAVRWVFEMAASMAVQVAGETVAWTAPSMAADWVAATDVWKVASKAERSALTTVSSSQPHCRLD